MTSDALDLDLPITTDRLVLRAPVATDAAALHTRRNDPSVARWQSWPTPFPADEARAIIDGAAEEGGPTRDNWWMLTIDSGAGEPEAGSIVGDVGLHLDASGTVAEIGYSLHPRFWRRGYATEAAGAVVARLFSTEPKLVRVEASTHPDNHASASVLEHCGFIHEGRSRFSFPPRHHDETHSDGVFYGLLRTDHRRWAERPTAPPAEVALVEVTSENLRTVRDLATHKSQERLVAPVMYSLGQALHPPVWDGVPVEPWHRAVLADGDIVGFVMLGLQPNKAPYLWRLLIDRQHQRRGIGRRVLDLVVDEAKRLGATELSVSWVPGHGSPERFYLEYGFHTTGDPDEDGEIPGILSI